MMQPVFVAPPQAPPRFATAPPAVQHAPRPVPMLPAPGVAQAPAAPPRTVIRGLPPDAPPAPPPPQRKPLVMPAPDELGVPAAGARAQAPAPPPAGAAPLSWDAARQRMKELGISGFYFDTLAGGGCRFTCWMNDPVRQESRRIESEAASEMEAISRALARAAELRVAGR